MERPTKMSIKSASKNADYVMLRVVWVQSDDLIAAVGLEGGAPRCWLSLPDPREAADKGAL